MEHHHHNHNHHHSYNPATGNRFLLAIGINLFYVAAEFYLGFRYDSVGLLADAGYDPEFELKDIHLEIYLISQELSP